MDVHQQAAHIYHRIFHDGQGHIVGYIVPVGLAQIVLHGMAQGVEGPGEDLHGGHGRGVGRVEDGKYSGNSQNGPLPVLILAGNDRAGVHLRAGAGGGDHRAHGDAGGGEFPLLILHSPDVLVQYRLSGDYLAAVHHAAAAYGQNEVHAAFPDQPGPLLHLGVGGVGHDAGEVHDFLTGRFQQPLQLVVDAVGLDGASAIGQQDSPAVPGHKRFQMFYCGSFAKVDGGGIGIDKFMHENDLLVSI